MSAYSTSSSAQLRSRLLTGCAIAAAAVGSQAQAQQAFQATPTNTVNASVNQATGRDTVTITGPQALIDWTPIDNAVGGGAIEILAAGDELRFQADNLSLPRYTVLNRINPADTSRAVRIDGLVNSLVDTGYGISDGSIWFYTPGGIILGSNARFDVGSLVLTTNAIQVGDFDSRGLFADGDTNAFAGRIEFRGAPDSKSFITVEAGAQINAASSYVALVSPRVAQRGAITVNGSAALIAAESANVTIPVSGNLFDISVFSGSKVDTAGETVLDHSGSTQISDVAQSGNTRSVYMVAVPKNDAITMLVSGTVGYEAASQVSAESGAVILLAGSNATINFNNPNADAGPDATIIASGLAVNTRTTVLATEFALDATTASSDFRRDLFSFASKNTVTAANGFAISIGLDNNGQARFGNERTSISLSSDSTMSVAGDLTVHSQVGSFPSARVTAPPVSVTVDNATLTVGGTLSLRSQAIGEFDDPGEDAFGGAVVAVVRNNGLLDVTGPTEILSGGYGGESGYGIGGIGGGGLASLTAESGGQVLTSSLTLSSAGFGGEGVTGGAGQGGSASLTVDGGSVETGYGINVQSIGQGGDSRENGGQSGSGEGGTAQLIVSNNGTVTASGSLRVTARGEAGSELGYGSITGGAALGGTAELSAATGGIITASSVTADATAEGGDGSISGGDAVGGDVFLTLTGGSKLDTGNLTLLADGDGGEGDGANGGVGTGGDISVSVTGAMLDSDSIEAYASGTGGQTFSGGTAGSGIGGSINLTSNAGGLISGANLFQAAGEGGDSDGPGNAGSGTGGVITVRANGGAIKSVGDSLRFIADGTGGNNDTDDALGPLARGGIVDIGVTTGGELSATTLFATADGGFDDQNDGISLNHGGAAVGGTAKLSVAGGAVTASGVTLSGTGRGAVSGSGGTGGAGFQGRAELTISGGTVTLDTLDVTALAIGGPGYRQDGDISIDAGSGGSAGIGPSPFAGEAGAFVTVTAGSLSAAAATIDASSTGGFGGNGDEFDDGPLAGAGGDAAAGAAVLTTSGTGSVEFASVTVRAIGMGGGGGDILLFDSFSTDGLGGAGGTGTGGLVSVTLGGTGSISPSNILADARGTGGAGGDVRPFFSEGAIFGNGRGGSGGDAFGGGANVTINDAIADFVSITADSSATAGNGGTGPQGADGGAATGGSSTLAIAAGDVLYSGVELLSEGSGGDGASGLGGDAGSGGAGFGGNATLTVGATANVTVDRLLLSAAAEGGSGGTGADNSSGGFRGGNGEIAVGGTAGITINGGSLSLFSASETPPVTINVFADAGSGGSGGSASEGDGGTGGDGASALGGTGFFTSNGGAADLFGLTVDADGSGGAPGSAGAGGTGISGGVGFGQGGAIEIKALQAGAPNNRVSLGFAQLDANGDNAVGNGLSAAGRIDITATGANPGGILAFDAIEADALGAILPEDRPARITFTGADTPILVDGDVFLTATGAISLAFTGDSGLRAGGDAVLNSSDSIRINHAGQAAGGAAASLSGREVVFSTPGEIFAQATSRVDASDNLSISSGLSTSLGSARVLGSLSIDARGDATIGDGSQIVVDRSVTIRSGDDIIIGTGALLRAANDPPAESGYGATDPLAQETQLRLYAGALFSGEGASADIRSLIINGDVQSPGRTMQLEANAIQGADGTTLSGGNLFVRKLGTTPPAPSDDFGQLAAPCLEGSVCLGNVAFTGRVEIGGSGFAPTNLRISGDLIGADVFAGATNTVQLGRAGFTSTITATNVLTVDARDGDLLGLGTISLTGGTGLTSLYAGGNLSAPGLNITAPNGLDLVSGGDVILGKVDASLIRTRDQDLSVINPGGITAQGVIELVSVTTAGDLLLDSGIGVTVGTATIASGKTLTVDSGGSISLGDASAGTIALTAVGQVGANSLVALSGDVTVESDTAGIALASVTAAGQVNLQALQGDIAVTSDLGSAGGVTALGRSIALTSASGLNILSAQATAGDLLLATTAGDIKAGTSSATGALTLNSAGSIGFSSLTTGAGLSADAAGAISGGDVVASGTFANLNGASGLTIGTLVAETSELLAPRGAIKVASASSVPGGITASGGSVSLTGPSGLKVTLAEASSGDLSLAAAGDLIASDVRASGAAALTAGGLVSVANLLAGSAAASGASVDLNSSGDLRITDAVARSGNLTLIAQGKVQADTLAATNGVVDVNGAAGISIVDVSSTATVKLASANGAVVATGSTPTIAFDAVGKSVALIGKGALSAAVKATAGDAALTSLGGSLTANGSATGSFTLTSAGGIGFTSLQAGGALSMAAQGDVNGGSATAASILVTTPGAVIGDDFIATNGTLAVLAGKGITLDTAVSTGTTTLKTDQGIITILSDVRPGQGLIVNAPSINLTAQNGLNIAQAVATAGDLKLTTVAGDLIAGTSSATGSIALNSAGALGFVSLTAQQGVTLNAAGAIVGDAIASKAGAVSVLGTKGVTLGSIAAAGPLTLGASAGTILVANDLATSGPIQATAQAVSLTAINDMIVAQAQATGGDIVLQSKNGSLTLGQASATKGLTATAANLLSVTGTANASTIAFTSKDIALGSGAQVGSVAQTSSLTFTSTADRTFLGGSGAGGYRLDGAEIGKIAAQNITVSAQPQGQVGTAFAFVEPASASIVMESLNFTGAQLGSAGTFTINSSRAIGVTGDVLFKGFSSGQRVLYQAGQEISLSAETGLVRVVDNSGGLAGVLELRAPQVTAMSVPARAQIPNLSLNDAEQRLGTNDQVENDGGYFQAGKIIVRIDRLVFIQNSGGPGDLDARRGFSANEMEIVSTGSNPAQVVINGRVGTAVGSDLAGAITLTGDFDTASTFSGCAFGSTICGGPSPSFALGAVSSARDQIEDEEDEDEKEEALQASQTRPDPIIQFLTAPSSRFDPLIDEPVTGAGNEDFWETPLVPSPGR